MVFGDVIPSIHQVASHNIDEVQRSAYCWYRVFCEGKHISSEARYCSRDDLPWPEGRPDLGLQIWVGVDLPSFRCIGNLLEVLAIPTVCISVLYLWLWH